ncbi:AIPR family protein [Gracilibacillus suaedae]|uniref:AIPR family protein n=1 Tax=Gracilibacillus suaedae TaxID=2820273 RepID=UPI001ABE10AF|nr:AIPR family protein [Gracilibacillus suaedae]
MRDTLSFAENFLEDIIATTEAEMETAENIFVEKFCDFLIDAEECFDYRICNYRKSNKGIKINAYEYTDDFDSISIFVSEFDKLKVAKKINSNTIRKGCKRGFKFFTQTLKGLKDQIEESHREAFEFADMLENNVNEIRKVKIYFLTNGVTVNDNLEDEKIGNIKVSYHIWDIERLFQFVHEKKGQEVLKVNFKEDFGESLQLVKMPDENPVYDCYVGVMSGELLARVYDYWGQRLIERNVRSFLQARGKINRGIRDTISKNPYMFMAYNNGISTVAEEANFISGENENMYFVRDLTGWQIVNGGQTTASLYQALKNKISLKHVFIQIKLTVIKESNKTGEIVASISKYANSQNKISVSDLSANDPFQVNLENLSRTIWVPNKDQKGKGTTKWFFERARGQYLVEVNRQGTPARKRDFQQKNPKKQVIKKTDVAKFEMSWRQHPDIVSKGAETNFLEFIERMKECKVTPDNKFYKHLVAKAILFKTVDKIVKEMDFGGYKANIVTYTIAYFSYINKGEMNFDRIWENQEVDLNLCDKLRELSKVIFKHITNTPSDITNVTQWCKKIKCWEQLKGKNIDTSPYMLEIENEKYITQ